jgi:ubiquinone/menaquinone biosynthesis C-methylase UbiE
MKKIETLTPEDIKAMSYNEIIGLVRETNRTPGGLNTIKTVSRMLNLNSNTKILDIGTSTGHTALEFGRLLNCEVIGIDINDESIKTATDRCSRFKLDKVKFQLDDATNLSFKDGIFDVVFAGNVTSLVNNREAALKEYWRVLKPNGYLVAVPMYYIKDPSDKLVDDVRKAIQVNIEVQHKDDWKKFFLREEDEIFEEVDFKFLKCSDDEINEFCENILKREHLKKLSKESMETLKKCYYDFMHLFNDNNSHMGFTVFIIRRKESDVFNDPELYHSERI